MTRKKRLLTKLFEIEKELDGLVEELEDLIIKKQVQAKSAETSALYDWIYGQFFRIDDDLDNYAYTSYCKGIETIRKIIEYVELRDPVKIVYATVPDREVYESYIDSAQFERQKEFYVHCPVCGAWVEKTAYKCSCNHHFREYEWVAELSKPDGKIERYIRNEFGVDYEVVIDGVTYPAEWVLTSIEKQAEIQNGGDSNGEHLQKAQKFT